MATSGKGIGNDHPRTGTYVIRVGASDDIRVGLYGSGTPGLGVHGDAARLKLGPHRAVDDQDFAGGQLGVEPIGTAAADQYHVMSSIAEVEI
jgi:hypothetical protein